MYIANLTVSAVTIGPVDISIWERSKKLTYLLIVYKAIPKCLLISRFYLNVSILLPSNYH